MRTLTFLTKEKNLTHWLAVTQVAPLSLETYEDGTTEFTLLDNEETLCQICAFLQKRLILKNPVLTNDTSSFSEDMLLETFVTPMHTQMLEELRIFIKEHPLIHLDGYFTFMMHEYQFLICKKLYSLIRHKLTKK